jgi:hypothetical protein
MRKLFFLFTYLFLTIDSQYLDDKDLDELFDQFKENKMASSNQLIYFLHIREEKQKENLNYMAAVVKNFLLSMHVSASVYNWKNHDFVILTSHTYSFDLNDILGEFKDWFDKGGVRSSGDFSKSNEL